MKVRNLNDLLAKCDENMPVLIEDFKLSDKYKKVVSYTFTENPEGGQCLVLEVE